MRKLLILIISFLTYSATACECKVGYSMDENFKDAALVAKVEVIGINDTSQLVFSKHNQLVNTSGPFTSGFAPRLKIVKVYKGSVKGKTISLSNREECGDRYTIGHKYILFIYRGEGSYYTRICENNFPASDETSMRKLKAVLTKS